MNFIRVNISDPGTHVQIVLATHSPIILSDIPKQNTIFLKKEESGVTVYEDNEETFAANIFSLYRNAFFLDESGIGLFAEEKLCRLIRSIHGFFEEKEDPKLTKDDIIREINCIGDPYIRNKFKKEYETAVKFPRRSKLDEEIEEMEKQLTELKKKRGN